MRIIGPLLLFTATLFADPRLLPLKDGNSWTYQERNGQDNFTIKVGTPAFIGGNVYYRLTGYVAERVWVRFGDHGALYYRDEENDRDVLLTSFEPFTGGWFNAPLRICDQLGQVQEVRGDHKGPAGPLFSTVLITYRTFGCADVGMLEEQYALNIGMVERKVNTIAGPRTYDLVAARIGASTIQTGPGASFRVSPRMLPNSPGMVAALELNVSGPSPVALHYLSSQEFDVAIRADNGAVVWQWSEGKAFLPVVREVSTFGRTWSVNVPLTDRGGFRLPPGRYELEAWIVSGVERPQFAGTSPFEIPDSR